jgi:hypothetical protein
MFVLGFGLVFLCGGLLIVGTTLNKGSIAPVHYNMQENDEISWGVFDNYYKDGTPLSEYKAVLNAKIISTADTLMDNDTEPDLSILTEAILGTFSGMDLKIPVYLDIYTITSILIGSITPGSMVDLPSLSAIHVVTSQSARALQTVLENLSNYVLPSEENATTLAKYASFFNIGMLPTSFNYTILHNFFDTVNVLTDFLLGFPAFEITEDSEIFKVVLNSTTYGNLSTLLQEDLGIAFYDNETTGNFVLSWDKNVDLLKECMLTVTYRSSGAERRIGIRLVRTTMTDSYPDFLSETDFSLDLASSSEITMLKVSNLIMLGLSATTLIGVLLIYRKTRR